MTVAAAGGPWLRRVTVTAQAPPAAGCRPGRLGYNSSLKPDCVTYHFALRSFAQAVLLPVRVTGRLG